MKTAVLVMRLLGPDLTEAARMEIPLVGDLAANVNSACPYHVECFIERRDWIAQTEAPIWDVRS